MIENTTEKIEKIKTSGDESGHRTKKTKKRFKLFLAFKKLASNRHVIIGFAFFVFACLIFTGTFALQINSENIPGMESVTGVSRERTISAPRGNIYDRYGIPLAYSESINVLYLCNANLENDRLNSMLLDLALLLEENDVEYADSLKKYISINPYSFEKELWEIVLWQTDRHTFNLSESDSVKTIRYDDTRYAKTDPENLFNYLRYTLFSLDYSYNSEDAYRILRIRYEIFMNSWDFRNGKPIEIARDVPSQLVAYIEEQNYRFTGILSGKEYERRYVPDAAYLGHVIGYMGAITSRQYNNLQNAGYRIDDYIGQSGVEYSAERYLKGIDGVRPYNILTQPVEKSFYYPEDIGKTPVPGNDVLLTIDLNLQKVAVNALAENIDYIRNNPRDTNKGDADSGAVVMLDVRTGEVLVMASYPGYNPNDFIMAKHDEESNERMLEVLTNTRDKPMLNRTFMEIYAPGSTFKPMTAIAALEQGVSTNIRCGGTEIIGEWEFRCLAYPRSGHGNLNLYNAMAQSCNIYFHKMGVLTGIDNIDRWMKIFGLGEYTGIDLPGEERGLRANRDTKKLLSPDPFDQIWFPADTAQTAIGQFDNKFTILQLAVYTAGIATGYRLTPHVIKEITTEEGIVIHSPENNFQKLPAKNDTLKRIRDSMVTVSKTGTARRVFADYPISVASKTGTAETGLEDFSSSNALFVCFAPADNPEIAIAQVVEKGVWGSNTLSIAYDLMNEYFGIDNEFDYETVLYPVVN